MSFRKIIALFSCLAAAASCPAAESEPASYPGLREIRLIADVEAIRPGEAFTLGLLLRHEEGFHTYWRNPGVVGVPTLIEWLDLPEGFAVGEVQWPAPRTTLMATLTAWGYRDDTCLLVPARAPLDLAGRGEITLRATVAWMCCARTCHPGFHEFTLTLPVNPGPGSPPAPAEAWHDTFAASRARLPAPAPEGWTFEAREVDAETIQMVVRVPGETPPMDWDEAYFFSHDNQVDSDAPQSVAPLPGGAGAVFTFARPSFAPEHPLALSGVLRHPSGWPGTDRDCIVASAPWPGYEVGHVQAEDVQPPKVPGAIPSGDR